jgi:putative acetyltransferase
LAGVDRRNASVVLIRRETDADASTIDIDIVHQSAFARPDTGGETREVDLVRRLRADAAWVTALSLVAEHTTGAVVGHVVCTVGPVDETETLSLGPLGVLPAYQAPRRRSSADARSARSRRRPGVSLVALLGHVEYYARFGFVAARSIGVIPPDPTWDDHFQAGRLHTWNPALGGVFRYAAAFDDL